MQDKRNRGAREEKEAISDEEIIELYWNRDENAIKQTDIKYGKYLFKIAYNILHDRMDCEECVSDTYLGTWNSIPPTRPAIFHAYLARITRNKAIKYYKKNTTQKRIPTEMILSLEEIEDTVAIDEQERTDLAIQTLRGVLPHFLEALEEQEEFIFVCRYYYCDSVSYIAKILNQSERTVYRELEQLRERLKQMMEEASNG